MNEHLQALGAFFLVLLASILSQRAEASAVLAPVVSGYSGGSFSAASGSFSTAANAASYGATGVVNVGGKAVTVPATLRMASNAGQFAKNAMRLNPWALVGTLALPWLLSEGMEWIEGQGWQYTDPNATIAPEDLGWAEAEQLPSCNASLACGPAAGYTCLWSSDASSFSLVSYAMGTVGPDGWSQANACHETQANPFQSPAYPKTKVSPAVSVPAGDPEWEALPSPIDDVAPELPFAPYVDGAPVDAPEYDFAPFSVPVGEPYTKPDGSTAQPMAKVSPNGDKVTVDSYEQPLTDTNGDPVPNPQPQDTPEPAPNHCEQNPNSIGCAQFGDMPAPDVLPETQIPASTSVVPIGGPGVCPAAVTTSKFGLTWSYQPICDFAEAVKPFVLGFAWLGFAYIVAGTVRT